MRIHQAQGFAWCMADCGAEDTCRLHVHCLPVLGLGEEGESGTLSAIWEVVVDTGSRHANQAGAAGAAAPCGCAHSMQRKRRSSGVMARARQGCRSLALWACRHV